MQVHILNVFTGDEAAGNPAAVVKLDDWFSLTELQRISTQLAQPVTAFIRALGTDYEIRWFAADIEINLCGHGSLAAAASLFATDPEHATNINFVSQHGIITVNKQQHGYTMSMPSWRAQPAPELINLVCELGINPVDVFTTRDLVIVANDAQQVADFQPDFAAIKAFSQFHAVIVTAPSDSDGYVLRYFAPSIGINEDIATGSAQCSLVPYWNDKLGHKTLQVQQLSQLGGYFKALQKDEDTIELTVNVELAQILEF